jgi:uncharacterized protein YbjQ (UPF0145 family)
MGEFLVSTVESVPGYEVKEILGTVTGNTVRAKHLGKDILAGLKKLVGGELEEYTDMLNDAREESMNRMVKSAKELGADAVIGARFMTSAVSQGAAELLAFGTAVKLKKKAR